MSMLNRLNTHLLVRAVHVNTLTFQSIGFFVELTNLLDLQDVLGAVLNLWKQPALVGVKLKNCRLLKSGAMGNGRDNACTHRFTG